MAVGSTNVTATKVFTGPPPKLHQPRLTHSSIWHYDYWVLGFVNWAAWGCSTAHYLLPQFRANVGRNLLELGAGTGYYLRHGRIPRSTRITIVDQSPGYLRVAKERAGRQDARTIEADVRRPLPLKERFDSVSMYYLLHEVPASVAEKCNILSLVKRNMTADGVLHGASILGKGIPDDNFFARFIRKACTKKGLMHNAEDNAFEFERALRENFKVVDARTIGCVFVFRAQGPKYGE